MGYIIWNLIEFHFLNSMVVFEYICIIRHIFPIRIPAYCFCLTIYVIITIILMKVKNLMDLMCSPCMLYQICIVTLFVDILGRLKVYQTQNCVILKQAELKILKPTVLLIQTDIITANELYEDAETINVSFPDGHGCVKHSKENNCYIIESSHPSCHRHLWKET